MNVSRTCDEFSTHPFRVDGDDSSEGRGQWRTGRRPECARCFRVDGFSVRLQRWLQCIVLLLGGVLLMPQVALAVDGDEQSTGQAKAVSQDHAEQVKRGTKLFKEQVRPILITHCLDCHGGKSIKADFDLATRDALMDSGYVGTTAEESYLMELITHASEPHMPLQAERLPDASIDAIRRWIDLGAPYDQPLAEGKAGETPGAKVVTEEDRQFWAFQPLRPVEIPEVENETWCRTPVDRFILAAQEAKGLHPNPVADRRTLIRRAYLDLLGLPAGADLVDAFVDTENPNAWSELVDGLLQSPHYGERWARHWMDVARFAESHGYEQDYDRPHAYHYRDFLIKAFNRDMPFDQFLQWQLAGDELAPDDPLALMATGFLGAGAFPTQLTEAEFESARYDELDDMVTTTGVAFLGLSVGCARCHDHKYDPIPLVDYYRMAAAFTTTIRSEIELDLEPQENEQREATWNAQLQERQERLREFEQQELPTRFADWIAKYDAAENPSPWQTLRVVDIQSTGGTQFESQQDGSWLAVGEAPEKEVLTIVAESSLAVASRLRLEALTHPSLPQQGPGRAGNGNFALGNVRVRVAGNHDPEQDPAMHEVVLKQAVATHQQNQDSLSVMASIDQDAVSGWAVDGGGIGNDQAAVFEFAESVKADGPSRWEIQLTFQHPNTRHAIGRFRLSLSDRADAPVAVGTEDLAPEIKAALAEAKAGGDRESEAWKTAQSWYAKTLPEWQPLHDAVEQLREQGPGLMMTKVMVCSEGLPHLPHHADGRGYPHFYPQTFVLSRGDVDQKQQEAIPGFLQVLMPANSDVSRWNAPPTSPQDRLSYRRSSLANWMTDVDQGAGALVARVIVNRVWQHHFGRGLVATPNDFGISGERPSHPDLLDWLASDLVANGWRLKRLHQLIMTSSVYMQSAEHDEARAAIDRSNQQLWRWTPRRLEAEAIRDSMLAVSGKLDPNLFGPGTLDQGMNRRSIYFFIKRSKLIPIMMLFDWPEHLVSIGQRSSTTIAPQALMFLNSPQGREYSTALAQHLPSDSADAAVAAGFRQTLARLPTAEEQQLSVAFLDQQEDMYRQQQADNPKQSAYVDFCQMLMSMNEFVYIE